MRHEARGEIKSFHDLKAWQLGRRLTVAVYQLTEQFPSEEKFGLISQMRRSAVSVPSNIAEGHSRRGLPDYINFVSIANGSLAELETQLIIAMDLGFCTEIQSAEIFAQIYETQRVIAGLRSALQNKKLTTVPT